MREAARDSGESHPGPPLRAAAPQIAVIGGGRAAGVVLERAEEVGRELARAGANLVCGGRSGVMEAACRGAAQAGGFTIGLLPGADRSEANRWLHCAIPTGLGHFRNFLVVRAADGVIALPGAAGTLSEAAIAAILGKPLVTFPDALAAPIPGALTTRDPAEAVRLVLRAVRRLAAIGPGGSPPGSVPEPR